MTEGEAPTPLDPGPAYWEAVNVGAPPRRSRKTGKEQRVGKTEPRIATPPLRPLTPETSLGFSVIAFATYLGVWLYPWQRALLIRMLEVLPSGRLRFRKVVVIVARQNGKTTLAKVLMLWFIYVRQVQLVLGTAQDLEKAEETWQEAVDLAEEDPELSDEIDKVVQVNGKKQIILLPTQEQVERRRGGSRYKVKAANRRGGRGSAAQVVLLDELREHQKWDAWAAITKSTLAQEEALILAFSNAGDMTSLVLRHLRRVAHLALGDPDGAYQDDGVTDLTAPPNLADLLDDVEDMLDEEGDVVDDDDDDEADEWELVDGEEEWDEEEEEIGAALGIFEWSAPPGASKWDRGAWAHANPSMNIITPEGRNALPERNIASDAADDPDDVFKVEVMGQWVDGALDGPFPPGTWEFTADVESRVQNKAEVRYCVDTSHNRAMTYVGVAGTRYDGIPHVEIATQRAGLDWVPGWFKKRATARIEAGIEEPMRVVVQERGAPASGLVKQLGKIEGVEVVPWGGVDLGIGCGGFYDRVRWSGMIERKGKKPIEHRLIAHIPQPVLDVVAATAVTKPLGDAWVYDRKNSPHDAAPLMAVSGALWDLVTNEAPAQVVSAYEAEDAAVMMV